MHRSREIVLHLCHEDDILIFTVRRPRWIRESAEGQSGLPRFYNDVQTRKINSFVDSGENRVTP